MQLLRDSSSCSVAQRRRAPTATTRATTTLPRPLPARLPLPLSSAARPRGNGSGSSSAAVVIARAQQQQQEQADAPAGAAAGEEGSADAADATGCPFLAALPPPPKAAVPWWQRIKQFRDPPAFQAALLRDHDVVATPAQVGFPAMVLAGRADLVQKLLTGEGDTTRTEPFFSLRDLLGAENIGFAPEPEHGRLRRLLSPAFAPEAVYGPKFLPEIARIVGATLERCADACEAGAGGAGGGDGEDSAGGEGRVSGYGTFKRMTFQIIMEIMMGKEYAEAELGRLNEMFDVWGAGLIAWPQIALPFTRYGRAVAMRRTLIDVFLKDVAAARAARAAGAEVPGQLGVMVAAVDEDGRGLPDKTIAENILGLLFAGHDTTSTALTQLAYLLTEHPEVMARVREEQARLVARHGPGVTGAHLREMAYADAVIKESMRVQPIAGELLRVAARDFDLDGTRVEEGTLLSLPLRAVGAADARWAGATGALDPNVFNPDRWLAPAAGGGNGDSGASASSSARPAPPAASNAQMPFGYGPRFCLGYHLAMAEMKTTLALLGQSYDLDAKSDGRWEYGVGRVPADGLPTRITRRRPAGAAEKAAGATVAAR